MPDKRSGFRTLFLCASLAFLLTLAAGWFPRPVFGAPNAPEAVVATVLGNRKIQISWNTTPGSVGYNVYRSLNSGGPFATVNSSLVTDNFYEDADLTPSTTYYYQMTAQDANGDSTPSVTVSGTTLGEVVVVVPGSGDTAVGPSVNGSEVDISAGAKLERTNNLDGTSTATASVTADGVEKGLAANPSAKQLILQIKYVGNHQVAVLGAGSLSKLSGKKVDFKIVSERANLTIPAGAVDLDRVAGQLGAVPDQVILTVTIGERRSDEAWAMTSGAWASQPGLKPVAKVLLFDLEASAGGQSVKISPSGTQPLRGEFHYAAGDVSLTNDLRKLNVYLYDLASGRWRYMRSLSDSANRKVVFNLAGPGNYSMMEYNKVFGDLENHWGRLEIELMASKHVVTGQPDGSFGPERAVTRAEFAVMLARAAGLAPNAGSGRQFWDVSPNTWYFGYVEAAARSGLVGGYGGGSFGPDDPVSREQVASMVVRALRSAGKGKTLSADQVGGILSGFADQSQVSDWAAGDLALALSETILNGKPGNLLAPKAGATRAEAAVMIARYWKK